MRWVVGGAASGLAAVIKAASREITTMLAPPLRPANASSQTALDGPRALAPGAALRLIGPVPFVVPPPRHPPEQPSAASLADPVAHPACGACAFARGSRNDSPRAGECFPKRSRRAEDGACDSLGAV